eukprot:CAMPEP_0114592536 /NCGR_PEP_ID=MMETSP0125-20121206/14339_1 /TAXON_ID=485358 ORGANISM="Aristerostoma sp., Strain ATCC 50986" /NCGR_SAMPLE_ID=MMETSP0125 /ASSEMBLY_ACC=CAM_ASM_000245 /LENGTH=69 /DNA_ID=CAMNT_0001791231 /DNA_START=2421 /DNA_END=2630 /DNA_ORIENTATION=-
MTIHHIYDKTFRIVLTDQSQDEEIYRIDLDFEDPKVAFEKIGGYTLDEAKPIDSVVKLIEAFEDDADED